jgi:hypothetical protein
MVGVALFCAGWRRWVQAATTARVIKMPKIRLCQLMRFMRNPFDFEWRKCTTKCASIQHAKAGTNAQNHL